MRVMSASSRNDYIGSAAEWLHKHRCKECSTTAPVGFMPGYMVSPCGAVWGSGKTRGKAFMRLKPKVGRGGYLWVQVRLRGANTKVPVHRTVAYAFMVKTNDDHQVRHLDGNPHNNALSNIRWGSAKENADDREAHGRTAWGEKNGSARHSDADVASAMAMLSSGKTQRAVAAAFSCSQATVWRWARGLRRVAALENAP